MNPFDLEKQIAEWRRQMAGSGIKQPEILDELESHLRDDVAQQTRSGMNPQDALDAAVVRIGRGAALKQEFKKIAAFNRSAMRAALAFAGIPNHQLDLSMNNNINLEPRWATYLRSVIFLAPAFALWMLASVYVLPQLNAMWLKAGPEHAGPVFNQLRRFDNAIMHVFKDDLLFIAVALVLMLGLLEWRSRLWPRFRRASLGTGVFLLNLTIVLSLFIQFVAATVVAFDFMQHTR
jgi:hypothetical protein